MGVFFAGPIRRSFRSIPPLETKRLILRKILPSDEEDMYAYARDPETSRYLLWEPHTSLLFTRRHLHYLQGQYRRCAFFDWALVEKESGQMIGTCGFTQIHEAQRTAEIGYVIAPSHQRRGFAPEAVYAVMRYGFDHLGFVLLEAHVMEGNLASQKVLTRLGFAMDEYNGAYFYKRGKKERILTFVLSRDDFCENAKEERIQPFC